MVINVVEPDAVSEAILDWCVQDNVPSMTKSPCCHGCQSEFSRLWTKRRRHHCRLCGKNFCVLCTIKTLVPLKFALNIEDLKNQSHGGTCFQGTVCIPCFEARLERRRRICAQIEYPFRPCLRRLTDSRTRQIYIFRPRAKAMIYSFCLFCQTSHYVRHCKLCGERACMQCLESGLEMNITREIIGKSTGMICRMCRFDVLVRHAKVESNERKWEALKGSDLMFRLDREVMNVFESKPTYEIKIPPPLAPNLQVQNDVSKAALLSLARQKKAAGTLHRSENLRRLLREEEKQKHKIVMERSLQMINVGSPRGDVPSEHFEDFEVCDSEENDESLSKEHNFSFSVIDREELEHEKMRSRMKDEEEDRGFKKATKKAFSVLDSSDNDVVLMVVSADRPDLGIHQLQVSPNTSLFDLDSFIQTECFRRSGISDRPVALEYLFQNAIIPRTHWILYSAQTFVLYQNSCLDVRFSEQETRTFITQEELEEEIYRGRDKKSPRFNEA